MKRVLGLARRWRTAPADCFGPPLPAVVAFRMARRWDGIGGGSAARWLLPAALLHLALAVLASVLQASQGAVPPVRAGATSGGAVIASVVATPAPVSPSVESIIELTLLHEDEAALAARTALAHASIDAARPTSSQAPGTVAPAFERPAEAARRETSKRASVGAAPAHGAARAQAAVEGSVEPGIEPAVSGTDAPSAPGSSSAASSLSLDQLGIGTSSFMAMGGPLAASPFATAALEAPAGAPPTGAPFSEAPPYKAPLTEAERASQRLQASLRQPLLDAERRRGLGPEGPIVAAARRLVVGDETLLETSAVLNVRIDGGGRVTEVHVLDASNQNAAWQMIAARLIEDLSAVTLQRPGANQGWGLKLQLASAMQLPSGAAPGLRTDVLGQVLPGSAAPGATSLSLSPTSPIEMAKPIDPIGRHLDQVIIVELGLLKLHGDVADLASAARRVVRVAVLSVDETP